MPIDTCTCKDESGEKTASPHTCPYAEEIYNGDSSECRCCPYCTQQCAWDV